VELNAELVHAVDANRTRIDFDATIPWSERSFYRLGFYDFGESNRFNAQGGVLLADRIWGRYGFHASKLGLGLDLGSRRRPPLSIDVFGVDRPQVDLRGNVPLTSSLDFTLGLDNATRRADPIFGLRYHK
jgi:hypothetical protein